MTSAPVFLIFAALAVSAAAESPLSKVIALMSNLEAKIKEEGEAAQTAYNEEESYCEDQGVNLRHTMAQETSKVQALLANVEKDIAAIEEFELKMQGKITELTVEEQRLKDAAEERAKQNEAFLAQTKSINEVIAALTRTCGILERENQEGTESLAQINQALSLTKTFSVMVDAALMQVEDSKAISAFLQATGRASNAESEESTGEETAGSIAKKGNRALELLYNLLDKAKNSLDDINSAEINSRHTFEKLKSQIMEAMGFDNSDISKFKNGKAKTEQSQAQDSADKSHYEELLDSDKKAALKLQAACLKAGLDFKQESEARDGELKALEAAKEAIAHSAGAQKLTYNEDQASAKSLLQLGSSNVEAVNLVRKLAHQTHSSEIERLASRIASTERFSKGGDPTQKVQSMIMDMVSKLEKEESEEASHKEYCDKEMSATLAKKDDKSDEASKIQLSIDDVTAKQVVLREDLTELQAELAEMAKSQAEMDQIRNDEKTLYTKSHKDMEDGLEGVKIALKVLREYYEQSGGDGGQGIISLLEVVESDFSKTIAELVSDETGKAQVYSETTKENTVVRKSKEVNAQYKDKAIAALDNTISEKGSDHDSVQNEIGAILEYKEHLDDMCIAKPEAYEVRKERREQEITGLKDALSVLSGADEEEEPALLQRSRSAKQQRYLRH